MKENLADVLPAWTRGIVARTLLRLLATFGAMLLSVRIMTALEGLLVWLIVPTYIGTMVWMKLESFVPSSYVSDEPGRSVAVVYAILVAWCVLLALILVTGHGELLSV
ncbi:MAG: hypothetical protein ACYC33_11975 [Thermoleophilia bacterium]